MSVLVAGVLVLGPATVVGAESRDDCRSGGCENDQRRCNDNMGDCRGSFSPQLDHSQIGPFCLPGSTCEFHGDGSGSQGPQPG